MIFRLSHILRDPRLTAKSLTKVYVDLDQNYSHDHSKITDTISKLREAGYTVRLASSRLIEITP